jgi:hypothetical protein
VEDQRGQQYDDVVVAGPDLLPAELSRITASLGQTK